MTKPGTMSATSAILPVGPLFFWPWRPLRAYTIKTYPDFAAISRQKSVRNQNPPGSNAHHPCTNCSCSQPDMAEGLNCSVRLVHLLRNYCHWRPSMPLEGSCNLALFQRSSQFKYGTFRGDLNMADKEKIFTVQTVCKYNYSITKQNRKEK